MRAKCKPRSAEREFDKILKNINKSCKYYIGIKYKQEDDNYDFSDDLM